MFLEYLLLVVVVTIPACCRSVVRIPACCRSVVRIPACCRSVVRIPACCCSVVRIPACCIVLLEYLLVAVVLLEYLLVAVVLLEYLLVAVVLTFHRDHLHVVGMLRFLSDINQPNLPTPFNPFLCLFFFFFNLYGPFNCISFFNFSRKLFAFSLCSSRLISALLVLSTAYLFMKVFLSPDIMLCG